MAHSYADRPALKCPQCGRVFKPKLWLIIDAAERPDLLEHARAGTIHHVACPKGHEADVDAPLVIFRPEEARPIIFSPGQHSTQEQDNEAGNELVNRLADSLGREWRDEWLDSAAYVPRQFLAVALSGDPAAVAEALASMVPPGLDAVLEEIAAELEAEGIILASPEDLERLLEERPELRAKLTAAVAAAAEEVPDEDVGEQHPLAAPLREFINMPDWLASYRFLAAHPELLSDEADVLLQQVAGRATAAENDNVASVVTEHRDLLRRCQEVGAIRAFAEKLQTSPEQLERLLVG